MTEALLREISWIGCAWHQKLVVVHKYRHNHPVWNICRIIISDIHRDRIFSVLLTNMAQKLSNLLAIALTVATGVVGHGHINNIVINGVYYQGYDPTSFPYMPSPPIVVGWTAADTDNGKWLPAKSTDSSRVLMLILFRRLRFTRRISVS